MTTLRRGGPLVHLTKMTPKDADLQKLQRAKNAQTPVCVTATASPGTIPNTGANVILTWQPPSSPIYDQGPFIGPANTQNIRIPVNGFYEFALHWYIGDAPLAANTSIQTTFQVAPTSDSGFGAPVFASPLPQYALTQYIIGGVGGKPHWVDNYRGVELHANDLVRFLVSQDGGVNITQAIVMTQEFRWLYPIPSGL